MRKHVFLFLLIIAGGRSAGAQALSVGVKGGVPLSDETGPGDRSRPYLVGPSVEVRLPAGFAIELDALYQHIGQDGGSGSVSILTGQNLQLTSFSNRVRGDSWSFPLLGKYYFGARSSRWQPFVGFGPAVRTVGFDVVNTLRFVDSTGGLSTQRYESHYRPEPAIGAVVAVGLRLKAGRLAILPEFRYTRWGNSDNVLRKNEGSFILGISF